MSWVTGTANVELADTELLNFGGAIQAASKTSEFAPTISQLLFSANTVAAVNLRLFFAPGVGSAASDQVEIFNQAIGLGVIPVGRYVTIIGGQGGCERVFRPNGGTPMTLRATSVGLAGVTFSIRIEWNWARAVI